MNCEHLKIHEYLDESLPPADRITAQEHLAGCLACREAVRQEQQLAETLSRQLGQAVETVALDAFARRNMTTAMAQALAAPRKRPSVSFWRRFAVPLAATAALMIVIFATRPHPLVTMALAPPPASNDRVLIHISCSTPTYTFHREGNLVVDALTSDTHVMDGALLVKN